MSLGVSIEEFEQKRQANKSYLWLIRTFLNALLASTHRTDLFEPRTLSSSRAFFLLNVASSSFSRREVGESESQGDPGNGIVTIDRSMQGRAFCCKWSGETVVERDVVGRWKKHGSVAHRVADQLKLERQAWHTARGYAVRASCAGCLTNRLC